METLSYQYEQSKYDQIGCWVKIAVIVLTFLYITPSYTGVSYAAAMGGAGALDFAKQKDNALSIKSAIDYMNKARDTGDGRYYDHAEAAVNRVLKTDPNNYNALRVKAWVQSGKHRFKEALATAKRASRMHPNDGANYGVMVDALVELGRYNEAVEAAQKMVDVQPGLSAYSRIAYLRWLYGDRKGSEEMLKMAINSGRPNSSETAWCIYQIGDHYFNQGQLSKAEEQYKSALRISPDYVHALAGMGKVRAAQGDYKEAIRFYEKAVSRHPAHANLVALGDVYAAAGDMKRAREKYGLVKRLAKTEQDNPETGLKMAIFYTNHDEHLKEALRLAQKDAGSSRDIQAWDALAWAYYKNGQNEEAAKAMQKALRLNTKDAGLFFHAGMIYRGIGDNTRAASYLKRTLAANPYFDLRYAKTAKETLREIDREQARRDKIRNIMLFLIPLGAALALAIFRWSRKAT